jgi:hypothetical protein
LIDYIADTNRQIEKTADDIERIDRKLKAIESGEKVTDKVYGGEGGWQGFIIEGIPVPEYDKCKTALLTKRIRLNDEYKQLAQHQIELCEQRAEVQRFLRSITDPHIKRIITYRCIDQLSWSEVATKMGGGNTEDGVKQAFWRFCKGKVL